MYEIEYKILKNKQKELVVNNLQLIISNLSFYTRSTAKVAFGRYEFHPSTGDKGRMQVPHLPPKGRIPYLSKKQIPDFATKGQNTLPVQKSFTAS